MPRKHTPKFLFDFLEVHLSILYFIVIAFTIPQSGSQIRNKLQLPWNQNSFTRAALKKKCNSFSKADSEDGLYLLNITDLPDTKKLGESPFTESWKVSVEVVLIQALQDMLGLILVSQVSGERMSIDYAELTLTESF